MLNVLVVVVSILGIDPAIVFSEDPAQWTSPLVITQSTRSSPDSSETTFASLGASFPPVVFRGQTVSDDMAGKSDSSVCERFCDQPFVREFLEGMNPFAEHQLHILPNYVDPFGFQMGTGSNGPQGYRLGWVSYNDFVVIPASSAGGSNGNMKTIEWNSFAKYSRVISPGILFSGTAWLSARWWDGPGAIPVPGQVDQFSTDLELGFFQDGPWSGQIAFHPQLVETYEAKIDHNAFNFDGRAIATYTAAPELSFVGGFAIWDRVDTMIVPHVGFIWIPNNRWEFRILYPRSRISYFVGQCNGADFWVYGQAEYTAEAWQSADKEAHTSDRMQITDDRVSLGLRWDKDRYSFYTETGYVFHREAKFAGSTPGFDLSDSVMVRAGFRY